MSVSDFLVFILYVVIFYFLFRLRRKKYKDPILKVYHAIGFWIKVFSCFVYCMFVLYISKGDTNALYYPEGWNIYNLILKDSRYLDLLFIDPRDFDQTLLIDSYNRGYLLSDSNYLVVKLVTIFSFFTAGKFMAINLFFSMSAFTGAWRLFRFFYEQYPGFHKAFAIAILYLPTFVFWSSGILKDPLCTGALGWFTYSSYHLIYNRKNVILDICIVMVATYVLITLKIYILISYVPFIILFLLLHKVNIIRSKSLNFFLITLFFSASFISFTQLAESFDNPIGTFASKSLTSSVAQYQSNFMKQQQDQNSSFSLGVEYDGSASSLAKIAPAAIIATFFRPFLWESKNVSTLFTSLESLMLMLFTLFVFYRVGIKSFFQTTLENPLVIYCLLYSLLFALFVGATTLNFGSLVRYKIPGTPFYLIALFLILYLNPRKKKSSAGKSEAMVSEKVVAA